MLRTTLVAVAIGLGISAVLAQNDPIVARKSLMKANGQATAAASRMVKGEAPFELAKAQEVFATYENAAAHMPQYFPENSKTGGDTIAAPAIWQNMADFRSRFETWSREIEKAKAGTKDLDTFKAEFATVTKACASCHETYRLKRS
jgi:cytochrome c556